MARTRCYRAGVLSDENFELADVSEHLNEPDAIVWIDLCAPEVDELRVVAAELGLHELAVEDAVQGQQRPKLDRYPDHSFLSTYAIRFDPGTAELAVSEIAAFLTSHALVTVRRDEVFDIEAVVERWDSHSDLARYGVGSSCTACWTSSSTGISPRCSRWMTRSNSSRTACSSLRVIRRRSRDARSHCARAWCCCAGSCCRCVRS